MATTTNKRIRFMDNNHAELTSGQITFSSELSSFPQSNAQNKFRSKLWKPSGRFKITEDSNDKLYINDGSDKTITLTAADYTTPALMASHIQTQLNASSSGWTVTYDSSGGTYKFTISNTGSVTLRLSVTTEAAWETLGFDSGAADDTGTSFEADEQRNHWPDEEVVYDLGWNAEITFVSLIGPLDEVLSISNVSTVKVQANNLDDFSSPPLDITITRNNGGYFHFMDDESDTSYRFWRISIADIYNPNGPEGISIGNIYLGDYFTFDTRNVRGGLTKTLVDPSVRSISEAGALFFDRKTKYTQFDAVFLDFLPRADKDAMEEFFNEFGTDTPFYVSFDPRLSISDTTDEFTKYVVFDEPPTFTHIKTDVFSMSMRFREVL